LIGYAQITTAPPDLNPGDPYRLVFITRDLTTALSADITSYDDFVTTQAESSTDLFNLGTSWRVIGSTASIAARDHTGTNTANLPIGDSGVPIYRLDGLIIANDYDDLWDGSIQNPLRITQDGATQSECRGAWTGTSANGTSVPNDELGAINQGVVDGAPGATTQYWIQTAPYAAAELQCLYAISDVLYAPGGVSIDIQTGKKTDCKGTIAVVVFGSSNLDVVQIDQSTLSFDGLDVSEKRNGTLSCTYDYSNSDDYTDLICRYQNALGDATLTGNMLDGSNIQGNDTYCVF
jgi:hypothetical protein